MFEFAIILIFPAAMAFAAVSDLITMTISNRLSLALVAAFVVLAVVTGMGWAAVGWHVAAGGLVLVVTFVMFALGWIGGGDAKLAAATALWLGWSLLMEYALYASLLGGVLTIGLLLARSLPLMPNVLLRQDWFARLMHHNTGIPYGIALAAAGLWLYPTSFWMNRALLP